MWPNLRDYSLREHRGLLRSVFIYHCVPGRHRQLQRFYGRFLGPGDLCFDVGAHVGNRIRAWQALGARVVAVEPQPICMDLLQRWYGQSPHVTLVDKAVGARAGVVDLMLSAKTPTVTSVSPEWVESVQQADSFAGVEWESTISVEQTTLDLLIAQYGTPRFCKIDVEGWEDAVLAGLTRPLPALSIEFVPAAPAPVYRSLDRLDALGRYEFNWSFGEEHRWRNESWQSSDAVRKFLAELAPNSNSGDIYARLGQIE